MELKPLHESAIESAMAKAKHYRLLNDPENAESICRDILEHNPQHQVALSTLILSLADQFSIQASSPKEARSFLPRFESEYDREYFAGLICERSARARLAQGQPGSKHAAYDLFRNAMEHFEKAESLSADDNDDAILRWNACLRTIRKRKLEANPQQDFVPYGD